MRSDGERSLGNRGTRRCEIRSGAAPAGPSSSAPECANNDLAPRVRGQSKPIKTMAYEPIFTPKIGRFASKFKALWAIWFRIFNSRLCAKWGPSLDRRPWRPRKPPPFVVGVDRAKAFDRLLDRLVVDLWRVADHADRQASRSRPQGVASAGSYPRRYWRDPLTARRNVAKCPKCHGYRWAHPLSCLTEVLQTLRAA